MSQENLVFYKHLAEKIVDKTEQSYDKVMASIRCKLSYLIMKSALLCLRGSRVVKINVDTVFFADLVNKDRQGENALIRPRSKIIRGINNSSSVSD